MLARQNNIDEVRPWAIIRAMAPVKLHGVWIRIATITSTIWLTDEYAIRDFKFVCCKQIELVMIIPHSDRRESGRLCTLLLGLG